MDKREFLKLTSAAVAAGIVSVKTNAGTIVGDQNTTEPIIRTLGKTGIKLPIISSGGLKLDNPGLIKEVFKSGIKHFDSALSYGNNNNDIVLGQMLKEFGRSNYIVSTKVLFQADKETGQYKSDATTEAFLAKLDESLQNQGNEYVDILYLHAPPSKAAALNEEMLNGLRKAKEMGKAKHLGIAMHSNQMEVIEAAIENDLYEVILITYNFRLEDTVKPALTRATAAGRGVVAMKTMAGGFLDKEKQKPINKSAALKWVLQDQNVHTAIMSIRTNEDLEFFKNMMRDIKMTPEEEKDLQSYKQTAGLFCHGCERCKKQCPYGIPIPDLMRSFMYAYGYNEPSRAKEVIESLELENQICSKCNSCSVHCLNGLDVASRIKDIVRLRDVPNEFLV
jgi:uncharacterized protein